MVLNGKQAINKYKKLKEKGYIVFEAIVGSHSYGLNDDSSDIDKKFVFIEPMENILKGEYVKQINVNEDFVGYEIGRLIELLNKNNPNVIELLFGHPQHQRVCHPLFKKIIINNRYEFLSKHVAKSYGDYAYSQIKKAQTTNKKFLTDMSGERKCLDSFSHVIETQNSGLIDILLRRKRKPVAVPLTEYLKKNNLNIENLTVSKIKHAKDLYSVYSVKEKHGMFEKHGTSLKFKELPKSAKWVFNVSVDIDGFATYCTKYAEWNEWNKNKSTVRFANNLTNEEKYDRKNLMHCHRLLNMCIEILTDNEVKVFRDSDRDYLLKIKNGEFTYSELIADADRKRKRISELTDKSCLKDTINTAKTKSILLTFRKLFYAT